MLELILKDEQFTIPAAIENLEAIKEAIAPQIELYKNLVVTPDTIKQAKSDAANLNKFITTIEERRKEIKRQVMAIYEPLEKQCAEVEAGAIEARDNIKAQLKAFEEQEANEKLMKLKTAFYEIDHPSWVAFSDVCPDKWKNKTETLPKLIDSIAEKCGTINAELAEIQDVFKDSMFLTPIISEYQRSRDKAGAIAYGVKMEKAEEEGRKRREEELKQQMLIEAEKFKREQAQQNAQEQAPPPPAQITPPTQLEPVHEATEQQNGGIICGKFEVQGTREQIKALAAYMRNTGIYFKIVRS